MYMQHKQTELPLWDIPAAPESWLCAPWSCRSRRGRWCPQSREERDQQPTSAGSVFKESTTKLSDIVPAAVWCMSESSGEREPTCKLHSGTRAVWTGCSSLQSGPERHQELTSLNWPHHKIHSSLLWMWSLLRQLTSRSRIQGVRGSKPGKRSLRSFSRRISTLTLKGSNNDQLRGRVLCGETVKTDWGGSSRWLRGVLLKPASVADGSEGTLQHLDVHWRHNQNKIKHSLWTSTLH